ncbi:ribonuclease H-like domain-containing protein [Emericellopsis atlantica]|uniref:Ribonuclease H-like domain-containing protein n=1 Tax=Emericellopsis atlantica TaxID=2614577 RepID=A0A9P7ZML2_9HYPO|nr:ribonuclease H-like domain-containing protein [Emericellopsis atlantica]KAG9254482.1 ribonuclease H-like domain-containing protein [Emericellopsis atlantica]
MGEFKTEIINTTKQIGDLVDLLILLHVPPKPHESTMYIDLEGVNLCREGTLSIFTLLIDTGTPTSSVYLIDVFSLGVETFETTGAKGQTLKDILQDENIPKVFFDVRNDSDVLYAHFGVALEGVQDVQLMESAARKTARSRKHLNSLAKCVEQYAPDRRGLASWRLAKEKGAKLFNPKNGGSFTVFEQRPIPSEIISYCAGDVQYLPKLWKRFEATANMQQDLVNKETRERILASQKPEYKPNGPNRTLAPWSEDQNRTLDRWHGPGPRAHFDDENAWGLDDDEMWEYNHAEGWDFDKFLREFVERYRR